MTQAVPAACVDASPIEPVLLDFAAGLAHDLSNALNSLGLHADMAKLMLERGEVESARRMLDGVQSEFRRNIDLMNALRRFATAPNSLVKASIPMTGLLDEARDCACMLLDADPLSITVNGGDTVGDVHVDRDAMVYVIVQLVRNAFEAGASKIDIVASEENGGWRLTVGDDGPGIDEIVLPKLFAMFAGSRRERGHLGLGLWVVDRLCKAQNATIQLGSGNGDGTGAVFVINNQAGDRDAAR